MPGKSIPLSPVDSVWYRMDRPDNHVMVTSLVVLGTPADFQRVKDVFAERLLPFARFRSRVVERMLPTPTLYWEPDPLFDIDNHIHHVALPAPGTKEDLLALVDDLASASIDYERPLWQVHVVDNVDGGSAVITRFHHCIADGTAMMAISSRLLDTAPDAPLAPLPVKARKKRGGMLDTLFHPTRLVTGPAKAVGGLVQDGLDLVTHPTDTLHKAQLAAEGVSIAALTAVKMPDSAAPLHGQLTGQQRVAYSDPVSLADVKAIGHALNATVNDVLVAGMAGALRHYLTMRGADLEHTTLRAVVPVDLRRPEKAFDLGNEFGLVFLPLPVGEARPLNRLRATKRAMDRIKRSPEAAVLLTVMAVMGRTPKTAEDLVSTLFSSKAGLVFTNVAGPRQKLYLAGRPIEKMLFWVPHAVDMSVGISIFSYNGEVTLGVISDAGIVPDPQTITDRFRIEFEHLGEVARAAAAETMAATPRTATALCAATTKSGAPCRNHPVSGSSYCRVHQPKA